MLERTGSTYYTSLHALRWQPVPHYCRPVIWGEWVGRFCAATPAVPAAAAAGVSSAASGADVQFDRWFDLCWDYTPVGDLPPGWTVEHCGDIDSPGRTSSSSSATAAAGDSTDDEQEQKQAVAAEVEEYTWQRAQTCGLDLSDIDPSLFGLPPSSLSGSIAAPPTDLGQSSPAAAAGTGSTPGAVAGSTSTPSSRVTDRRGSGRVVNRARIPTRRPGTSSRIVRHCPLDFACLQLLDDMDDAHIACVRADEFARIYSRDRGRGRVAVAAAGPSAARQATASRSAAAGDSADLALTIHRGYRINALDQLLRDYRSAHGSRPR